MCLSIPHGIADTRDGLLVIADTFNHRVLRVKHGRASVLPGRGRAHLRAPVNGSSDGGARRFSDGGTQRVLLATGSRVRVLAGTGRRG
jgi:hypothetical protein